MPSGLTRSVTCDRPESRAQRRAPYSIGQDTAQFHGVRRLNKVLLVVDGKRSGIGPERVRSTSAAVRRLPRPLKLGLVSREEIDEYLASVDEPGRDTLQALRKTIQGVLPEAEQGISYGLPAFRLNGKVVAGFAAFKNHLSYLPHSGSVLGRLGVDVAAYKTSKGALQFGIDKPLHTVLVKKLIAARLDEIRRS